MELEIFKYISNTTRNTSEYLKIISYKSIFKPDHLLLIKVNDTQFENDKSDEDSQTVEIYKVQFIASCKTKFEEEILVAFYVDENSQFSGSIITELTLGYHSPMVYLVDYTSYLKVCELTNETKLSFMDYFNVIKSGHIGLNGFINYKGTLYNNDQQKELFNQLDDEGK